jgi:hypothetical protein
MRILAAWGAACVIVAWLVTYKDIVSNAAMAAVLLAELVWTTIMGGFSASESFLLDVFVTRPGSCPSSGGWGGGDLSLRLRCLSRVPGGAEALVKYSVLLLAALWAELYLRGLGGAFLAFEVFELCDSL